MGSEGLNGKGDSSWREWRDLEEEGRGVKSQ